MQLLRLFRIASVVVRYGLDEFLPTGATRATIRVLFFWRSFDSTRAVRLRKALEALGPIFIKFGQLLSTRPDLVPADIAKELARLQDNVPPFEESKVVSMLQAAFDTRSINEPADAGRTWRDVFASFEMVPVAAASIAQVHFATMGAGKLSGREVAVKLIRPDIHSVIKKDVGLLYAIADLAEVVLEDGKRLRPREVIAEFDHKSKKRYENAHKECVQFLENPNNNIWSWSERNIELNQKTFDIASVEKYMTKAIKQAAGVGLSQVDLLKAVFKAGIDPQCIIDVMDELGYELSEETPEHLKTVPEALM
jgi:hypothetical protein